MTQRQLASLLCKFLGLYCLLETVSALGLAVQWGLMSVTSPGAFGGSLPQLAFAGLLPRILQGAIGVVLLIFADGIAAFMVPSDNVPLSTGRIWAKEISTIAFASIGLLTLSQAVPRIVEVTLTLYTSSPQLNRGAVYVNNIGGLPALASAIVQTLIGLWLFLRSRALAERFYPTSQNSMAGEQAEQA
jgi:hypothetical protein